MSTSYELTRCIVCESADMRELASAEDVRSEVEDLWAFHEKRLRPDTPPEHLMDRVAFSQKSPLRIVQCTGCGLVYRNPIERPAELDEAYRVQAPARDVLASLHERQAAAYAAQARRLHRFAGRRGAGIEVGSYVGAFLSASRDTGWKFSGVDVNPCTNAFSRSLGFDVIDGTLEAVHERKIVDAVAIWNCIDQLPDPATTVRAARQHLAPDGWLAIRAPNGAFYAAVHHWRTGPLGALVRGWMAQNNILGFPYRYGFTPQALSQLVERLGFRTVHIVGDVLVPTSDEWTKPWAAAEERCVKFIARLASRLPTEDRAHAPWFELYAVAI